ncbi:MAG TPA: hypothetical protein VEG27_13665 [Usitatibacter sp.]|nr:hypothetical protein [Usitatibacter sp.]
MTIPRRFWAASILALAVAFGQYAGVLHELGHAIEHVQDPAKHQLPGSDTCDQCSAYGMLFGAAPAWISGVLLVAGTFPLYGFVLLPAPSRTVVTARSRAPPSVL